MTERMTLSSKAKDWMKRHRWGMVVSINIILSALALYLSFALRFDGNIPADFLVAFYKSLPFAVFFKLIALEYFSLNRGLWRYAGMDDLIRIFKACSVSSLALILAVVFIHSTQGFPRSVFLIDWLLSMFLLGGLRGATRIVRERYSQGVGSTGSEARVLLIGAGDTAELAIRDLRSQKRFQGTIVGILDDDPSKQRLIIHGHKVLGTLDTLSEMITKKAVTEVLIAMPTAPKRVVQNVIHVCAEQRIRARIIPAISDYVSGQLEVQQIREVDISDLLGREPVELDGRRVHRVLKGHCVLVTGAGGSIGSELARQIAACGPEKLILLEMGESALFDIDNEIAKAHPNLIRIPAIANIRDVPEIDAVFRQHKPDFVFHAAAYKHVPLMELHPMEAIRNNVMGTNNLAEASQAHGVKRFVLISTDKAVKPENVMGATKRVAEMLMKRHSGGNTRFMAVRFGNVLGSAGSVVPIFKRQIAEGGPVCITHEEATRFFMTIPEAAQLVLQVGATDHEGSIFVLDMGKPVRILDMARNMIELSGLIPDEDIEIRFTGLRPGEKIHEELEAYGENLEPLDIPKINVLISSVDSNPPDLDSALQELQRAISDEDPALAHKLLMKLVTEKMS